jgi:hypothetical protein
MLNCCTQHYASLSLLDRLTWMNPLPNFLRFVHPKKIDQGREMKMIRGEKCVRKDTTRKTLIHGPIIYGALRFSAPQISSRGAPREMRHRYHLICGAPNKGCATHMWAPTSTIAWSVRAPHPWRMNWGCATHMAEISGTPLIHAPWIYVGPSFGKGGRHIRGAQPFGAPLM